MNILTVKDDAEIKEDVLAELKYEPSVSIADIGVIVKAGIVTLNGYATNYVEKWNVVKAAKRVAGVKAIADDIEVRFAGSLPRTDGDIAGAAVNQMGWSTTIPPGTVEVTVSQGWITLTGEVEWWYLKNAAEAAVRHLTGVKGVSNRITIRPRLKADDIETDIGNAFQRTALFDARRIEVKVAGNEVELRGAVRNNSERAGRSRRPPALCRRCHRSAGSETDRTPAAIGRRTERCRWQGHSR
jgi:osmotically-inducible protein OsmY